MACQTQQRSQLTNRNMATSKGSATSDHAFVCRPCAVPAHSELDTESNDKNTKQTTRKTVRFAATLNETKLIATRHEMSRKERRNMWWKRYEIDQMKPDLVELEGMHQNCSKKCCIRGLERMYWTEHVLAGGDLKHDNPEFVRYVNEFVPPSRPDVQRRKEQDCEEDASSLSEAEELAVYQEYAARSQQRARAMAVMDEAYVMEHVYGLPCSRLFTTVRDHAQWSTSTCCSCHSFEEKAKTTSVSHVRFGKGVMKELGLRFGRVGRKVGIFS